LTELSLFSCQQVRDLTPLADLTRLRRLNLRGCKQARDLSPLAGLTQLAIVR
jgi:hypothetical protein